MPCVAGNEPGLGRIKVLCEVFHHSLEFLHGEGLAPEHVGHGLGPETDIQEAEVWLVWGPVVLAFAGDGSVPEL